MMRQKEYLKAHNTKTCNEFFRNLRIAFAKCWGGNDRTKESATSKTFDQTIRFRPI